MRRAALIGALLLAGCFRPTKTARTTAIEPPSPAEIEAADHIANRSCSPLWSLAFPGLGQMCTGSLGEGAAMTGLGAAEIGSSVLASTQIEPAIDPATGQEESPLQHPAVATPLLAFQDLYVYSVAQSMILRARATRQLYAPVDSTTDLLAAPFNLEILRRPKVFLGLAAALAVGIGISVALDDSEFNRSSGDPVVFRERFDPEVGYPLGIGIYGGLFTHVGMAEESLFRGFLQSALARKYGETGGMLLGSAFFGLAHAPNALALETSDEKRDYLIYAVPTITALGTYLSWIYKDSGYSLAPSTAIHFWYDFLLSAAAFAINPEESPISAVYGIHF